MKKNTVYRVGSLLVIAVIIAVFFESFRSAYEVVSIKLFPNAERAFAYGERHLDDDDPGAYSIALATNFFWKAQSLDPKLPYVYHEIARTDFLRGKFDKALSEINRQIDDHGDKTPNSYYVRGLIEGYMGNYDAAIRDYKYFLSTDPFNWAAANDYVWVLLMAKQYEEAEKVATRALGAYPPNPWLLNSRATAYFELGKYNEALLDARKAASLVEHLTEGTWSRSYPGNDPKIAGEGVATFKAAVADNIHTIEIAIASSTVQSR